MTTASRIRSLPLALLLAGVAPALAQVSQAPKPSGESRSPRTPQVSQPPPELRRDVFRAETEVVLLDVVVRDRKGRTVGDLRPEEVEVYENGVRQETGSFRFLDSRTIGETLEAAGAAPRPAAPAGSSASAAAGPAAARPGESRHLNLVTLLFDQLGPDARTIARQAALSFLELENRPDVYVSVFQIGESLRLLQQFTGDHETARNAVLFATGQINTQYTNAVERLSEAAGRANALRDSLDAITSAGVGQAGESSAARLGQEVDMANMVVNALRMTDTLQREQQGQSALFAILALARQQQSLAGRKTILFFSEGVQSPPSLEHVLLGAISEANRANVSVYAVDARGLTTASDSDAARATLQEAAATSMRQQMLRGFRLFTREEMLIADTAEASLRMDARATLGQLAESTGGTLISHTNDVRAGIARAVGDLRGYYEIAYSPSNRDFDGHFRRIAVKVSRPGVSVQTRSGYYAMPPGEGTATFPYEIELLKVLRSPDPPRDLPIRTRAFRFGRDAAGQRYTVVLELPLDAVRFEKDKDPALEKAHFAFMGLLRASWGGVAEKFSQDAPVWLPRRRHDELKAGNVVFMRSFAIPAGRYRLETAAMDRQSGRSTAEFGRLSVPAEAPPVSLSSLAIVKRTEKVPQGALASDDPFRAGDARIVPWVGEAEVQPGKDLGLFFVAYVPPGSPAPQISLEFERDGHAVARAEPSLPAPDPRGRVPYVVTVPASRFVPGRYEVRAELRSGLDRAWERCSFRVASPGGAPPRGAAPAAPRPAAGPAGIPPTGSPGAR